MLQIIKELGNMKGHSDVEIIELEELGRVSLSGWNGEEYCRCWKCNEDGYEKEKGSTSFCLKPKYEPDSIDEETGEVLSWNRIGFELKMQDKIETPVPQQVEGRAL